MRPARFVDSLCHWRASDELLAEQFRSLRPQVPTMYLAVFINIGFLASITATFAGLSAFALPAALSVVIAARFIIWRLPETRGPSLTVGQMRTSMTISIVAAAVTATILSWWCQHILQGVSGEARVYVALFAALCTISCAASLSSLPLAAYMVVGIGTVPVSIALLLTGDLVLQSMGANMLLVSPLVVGMVYRQYQRLCRTVRSYAALTTEQVKVRQLAYHDSLTGLANRRAFLDQLRIASAGDHSSTLAVGMIDLDGFKVINDTYGHRTGDALLAETARRFRQLALGDAVVARLGGDEFAVLMRDVAALDDAQRNIALVASMFEQPFVVGGQTLRLTASIGLAHSSTDSGSTLELVNRADLAMYESKRLSGQQIRLFEPDMEGRARRRLMIEQALASDSESDLIELRYQPIFDAVTSRIVAFEALARWDHPRLGVISPSEFIPLAEQSGRIEPTTTYLLSMALRAASKWPDTVGISFNLSAGELTSTTLAARILDLIACHGVDPARVSIEVTETAMLSDFAAARSVLCALQRGGVRILLDDFGAGFASIGYLREIQFDGIKLDGSLIGSLMQSKAAHDLLIGVLHLCQAIGAPVTAEMVENQLQYDLLRALGVQKLQGFYLSQALTDKEALAACRRDRDREPPPGTSIVILKQRRPGGAAQART